MGSCSWTATSPNSLCNCLWSTPWPVGLTSEPNTNANQDYSSVHFTIPQIIHTVRLLWLTLCSDRLWDGARVAQAVGIDSSDNKQVDGVGEKPSDCVCFHFHHVSHSLPSAAGWLAVIDDDKTNYVSNVEPHTGINVPPTLHEICLSWCRRMYCISVSFILKCLPRQTTT